MAGVKKTEIGERPGRLAILVLQWVAWLFAGSVLLFVASKQMAAQTEIDIMHSDVIKQQGSITKLKHDFDDQKNIIWSQRETIEKLSERFAEQEELMSSKLDRVEMLLKQVGEIISVLSGRGDWMVALNDFMSVGKRWSYTMMDLYAKHHGKPIPDYIKKMADEKRSPPQLPVEPKRFGGQAN